MVGKRAIVVDTGVLYAAADSRDHDRDALRLSSASAKAPS